MIPSDPLRGGPAGVQGVDAVSANTCTPGGTKINWQALEEFFFNTDPNKVLQSQGLSFYKGIPVFTIEGERSGSFGAIFLTKKAKGAVDGTDTLRHEYGHTIQLAKLGVLKFSVCVGLPSWQNWGDDSYYNLRSMNVFVSHLRAKLQRIGSVHIVSERGVGYKLVR